MLVIAAMLAILTAMALVLLRGILGPTLHDRILATNAFGTNTVVAISLLAFMDDNPMFIDIALIYTLINFITTVALLKYFQYGQLGGTSNLKEDG